MKCIYESEKEQKKKRNPQPLPDYSPAYGKMLEASSANASFIKPVRLCICPEKENKQPFQTKIEKLKGTEGSKYTEHKLQKEPSGSKQLWMKWIRHEDSDHERCCKHIKVGQHRKWKI